MYRVWVESRSGVVRTFIGRNRYYSALSSIRFVKNFQREVDIMTAIKTEEQSYYDFRSDQFRRVFYLRPTLRRKWHFIRLFEETTLECRI